MTLDLFPILTFMQARGMKVSHDLLAETKVEVLQQAAERQKELDKLCGMPLNVNSPKQCAQYFYGKLGISEIKSRKTKNTTTDDEAMQRLARGKVGQPALRQAKLVQEIRSLQKLYSTYLNITFDPDGRMRGSYNPRGTKFGRLSSSKTIFGTGMNYQNLPQEFKKFLTADDGYVLVEVDKRQAEWVVVAYASGDANMIQAVENNLDVHVHTAHLMFSLPPEIVEYEAKIVSHETNPERVKIARLEDDILRKLWVDNWPRNMSLRQCGKKSNHGLNYDEGYVNFSLLNEMEQREGKRIVTLYHEIYPGIRKYYEDVKRKLQVDRTLTNCFGRKVYFMGEWANDLWKSAYSMIPQSTVVDSLNQGMVKIYHDKQITKAWNVDILAQVHDSILLQVPLDLAQNPRLFPFFLERVFSYVSPVCRYNSNAFQIATDAKVGLNWGASHRVNNPNGMREYKDYNSLSDLLNLGITPNGSGTL
jgi:DNA polymerase-1